MRKLASFLLTVTLSCMMLASCASKPTSEDLTPTTEPSSLSAFEGPVNDILDRIINDTIAKNILVDEELKGITCYEKSVDPDSCQDILGLTPAEFTSDIEAALEAKPDGSWFAHSIVLIRCKDGSDVAALAECISQGTNPARFGCIKAEAIVTGYTGQYILLCASFQNTCDAIYTTFTELSALPVKRIDRENTWNGDGMLG
ncbi:MAG: hypothetical protein GX173_00905 [Ruminococcaceae bacterium]|nr:hypothetical protein [Oscillospiraceae bacterium]